MTTKKFDVNKTWMKLIGAVILLNALILAAFLTSTPSQSPASTWLTYGYQLRYKLAPITDKKQLAALHLDSGRGQHGGGGVGAGEPGDLMARAEEFGYDG